MVEVRLILIVGFYRMFSRCIFGYIWRRNYMCVRFVVEVFGRRVRWCGMCGIIRARSFLSVISVVVVLSSTVRLIGICVLKVGLVGGGRMRGA